jgi:uncharacterized protein (DUF1499 family)
VTGIDVETRRPQRRRPGALRLLAVACAAGLATLCAAPADRSGGSETPVAATFLDFEHLARPTSPNTWLVAPASAPPALRADEAAPEFSLAAADLAAAWVRVVAAQPRSRVVARSDDGLSVEAEQRSALFRFVDDVSFRAVPLAAGRSTCFVYSRSRTGYSDFGVNRRRLRDWLAALQAAAGR